MVRPSPPSMPSTTEPGDAGSKALKLVYYCSGHGEHRRLLIQSIPALRTAQGMGMRPAYPPWRAICSASTRR
jgi:hypothetical protein